MVANNIVVSNCRDNFRPVLGDIWSELEGMEKDLFTDMEGDSVYVADVPIDHQDAVHEMLKDWNRNAPDVKAQFQFVADPTEDPNWQRWRREELTKEHGPATAETLLEKEMRQGSVVEFTDPETGITYIGEGPETEYTTQPFARRQGEIRWEDAGPDLQGWWKKRYKEKMKEVSMTLEQNGVQIIGGLPTINPAAAVSAKDYFCECFAAYLCDPVLIHALDRPAYERLRDYVMGGVEYLERGGVK